MLITNYFVPEPNVEKWSEHEEERKNSWKGQFQTSHEVDWCFLSKRQLSLGVFLSIQIPMAHYLSADFVKKLWPGAWAETDAENVPAQDNGRARLVFTSLSFIIWWISCTTLNYYPLQIEEEKSIFNNASHLLVDVLSQNWLLSFSNPLTVFCCRFEEFEEKLFSSIYGQKFTTGEISSKSNNVVIKPNNWR